MRAHSLLKTGFASLLFTLITGVGAVVHAQSAIKVTNVPDAQVESNVLQALAGNNQLASQSISSSAVYGTVTLSGSVPDEATRTLAEQVVSRVAGVKKVIDELTLGAAPSPATLSAEPGAAPVERSEPSSSAAQPGAGDPNQGSNPTLQSDGTMANSGQGDEAPSSQNGSSQPSGTPAQSTPGVPPRVDDNYPPPVAENGPPAQPGDRGSAAPPQADPSRQPAYPPYGYPRGPYGAPPYPPPTGNSAYGGYRGRRTPEQKAGEPVNVPQGTVLQVRTMQPLDSRSSQTGTTFRAIVADNVLANGYIAIPRGAEVTGVVSDATSSGVLKGRGELALQLTSLTLEGRSYPLVCDTWAHTGSDKTLRTVNSALGLGALGAVIGGVAGGGAGAAIGAGVGGAAGVGASAASAGGQVIVPAEAILSFHLTQQAQLSTVSQAELDRLGAGSPYGPGMRRRYPPPPPYAYGPYPYPYYPPPPRYRYPYPY